MSLAEVTPKYVRSDRCGYSFFLLKLLQLNIILILLTKILINELINPSNANNLLALKSNDSYQMTYNYVGNNNYVHQINWLENKMCRQLDDSCHPPKNNSFKYIIRHEYDSDHTAESCNDNYKHYA